jgi:hypothetical protein
VKKKLKTKYIMTQFEKNFDFVASIFGKDTAEKIFILYIKSAAIFKYIGYLLTLPVKFIKLFWKNLKEKGVV